MSSEEFKESLEQATSVYNEICDMARLILRRALPNVEPLQRSNSHFSPRLMGMMCSQAQNNLSALERERLGAFLEYVEEIGILLFAGQVALKDSTPNVDLATETQKWREVTERLQCMSVQLHEMLERPTNP